MTTENQNLPANWKRPDEFIRLQRLKQRKRQLAARLSQNSNQQQEITEIDKASLLEAKIAQKRKNPFAKATTDNAKKSKTELTAEFETDDSLFKLINAAPKQSIYVRETPPPPAKLELKPFDAKAFSKLLHPARDTFNVAIEDDDVALEQQKFSKHLPMDWSLKTRVRFFCRSELPATTLKTSQMASGLTSFVRCIDTQNSSGSLDISPATRFNQSTYYWQHPYVPWLTLFPRNAKENTGITLGERERHTLAEDWDHSFRGLFQLLRARQCPYFYLCANGFTVLFRAAGTGGLAEIHALMSQSTRGMRSALRQEGIEYTMPLKKDAAGSGLNRSGESNSCEESNGATQITEQASVNETAAIENELENVDEAEEDEWLESLGVDEKEIRRIQSTHTRKLQAQDMSEDFTEHSLLLIEGVECQGFFSFLLNAKSTISNIGRLAGVPPTLLAPVAFPKASMQQLATRSSKVRMDGEDYCSIEVKGVIMPTFLPYVCALFGESKQTFSATLASSINTLAFSKASQKLIEQPTRTADEAKQHNGTAAGQVFGEENLSDCGLLPCVVECMCRTEEHAIGLLERVAYDKEYGYAWS